jgi:hypothetical protein
MAMPLLLDAQQRQQIVEAVMAESTPAETQSFKPADILPYALTAKLQPIPDRVRGVADLSGLVSMKGENKVYLVTTTTAVPIVVDVLAAK